MTVICAASLILAGCASTKDLYRSRVDQSFTSAKPIGEVTRCLEVLYETAYSTAPGGERSIRIRNGYDHTIGLFVLTEVPSGTRIDFRRANSIVGSGNWRACG